MHYQQNSIKKPMPVANLVLATAISSMFAMQAHAQVQAQVNTADAPAEEEIVVTASRVVRSGFTAPTPTTVLGAEQIAQKAQSNLTEILNDVPSFRATTTPTTTGPATRGSQSTADLRGMGAVRTLVLFDGQRSIPATVTGLTDLNLIPTLLVDRVDIVSGGASAGWGSDAVSGVVNVVLKKHMTGALADIMVGQSQYKDSKENRLGLAGGTNFMQGRGNIVAGLDYDNNKGVGDQYTRPWGRENYGIFANTAANGLPQRLLVQSLFVANATLGGLITAVAGGAPTTLRGTAFGAGGTPFALPFGSLTSATQTVGNVTGAFAAPTNLLLQVPAKRLNGLARVSFDLSNNITAFASLLYARNEASSFTFPNQTAALSIRQDNAYLPASIKAQMPTGSTITIGRYTQDNFGAPQVINMSKTVNFAAGLQGSFGDGWSWELNGESGRNTLDQTGSNFLVTSRFNQAIDAVVSGSGQTVCRSTLTTPTDGCVPFNIFGQGSPSAAAEAYVRGGSVLQQVSKQTAAAFTLRGEPFSNWAGPISLATGAEYRKQQVDVDVDALSLARSFVPTNPQPLHGSYSVREGFAETVVPLSSKSAFAKSLDFDAAVRYTNYTTSGKVTTWKAGFVYAPVDQIKFRLTRSLDIRAPNLNELYANASQGTSNVLTNPFLGGVNAGFVTTLTSGNPDLKPERSKNATYGFVYQPTPALSLSADYYDIKIQDAIATVPNQTIINQCFAGNAVLCALVVRNGNQITQLNIRSVNIAAFQATGFDYQATYRMHLADLIANTPGELSLALSANYTINAIINDGFSGPVQRAGDVGFNTAIGRPKLLSNLSATYKNQGLTAGVQLRYISSGKLDNTWAEGVSGVPSPGGFTVDNNTVPSVKYLNLNAAYDFIKNEQYTLQLYGVINNALNRAPPPDPAGGGSTNPAQYDVIGRLYKLGLRMTY